MRPRLWFSPAHFFLVAVSFGYCFTGLTSLHKNSLFATIILANFLMVDPYGLLHAATLCAVHSACSLANMEHIDFSEFIEISQLSIAVLLLVGRQSPVRRFQRQHVLNQIFFLQVLPQLAAFANGLSVASTN
jgi:hypothetical protein